MESERPNPDALLEQITHEEEQARKGKLTIFFGAAPGVGKTYAMLKEAQALRIQGTDVVIGIVETHGRSETTALTLDLEAIPLLEVSHRGIILKEMDLDQALARRPGLLLVDELAHSNVPGVRHAKRWQDVMELLQAGIDVFSTLNVQHIESVHDVVAAITGVNVRERIPDSILGEAHEVRLIDLTVDELLVRLREGKIYIPHQAERATQNFFRKENLTALRELAMKQAASQVDSQMREIRTKLGIRKTWAVTQRLLVCVSWSPYSAHLIRTAGRMAQNLQAAWSAVFVETPISVRLKAKDQAQLTENLRLAEQLGAEVVILNGHSPAEEILHYAQEQNITQIIVGKPRLRSWLDRLKGSFIDELINNSGEIDIYVTSGEEPEEQHSELRSPVPRLNKFGYLTAILVVLGASLAAFFLFGQKEPADAVMLYLLGIVYLSVRYGRGPAIWGTLLSIAAFDIAFIPPYWTFAVADFRHIGTFAIMLVVALIISNLTDRIRLQADSARKRERRTAMLYAMSRELARTTDLETLAGIAAQHIGDAFDCGVAIYDPPNLQSMALVRRYGGADDEGKEEAGIVDWVWNNRKEAGLGTHTLPGAKGLYLPLSTPNRMVGVLAIFPQDGKRQNDPEQNHLIDAFVNQIAMSLERAKLSEEMQKAALNAESERLRSTLLSSVSHDLRTPLTTITGAIETLIDPAEELDLATRRDLLFMVSEEVDRLNRLIRNLLDMTRLESGAVSVKKEWQPLEEVVGSALHRLEKKLSDREVRVNLPPNLPLVPMDQVLIEQVLVNIMENAIKYTPEGSPIEINAMAGHSAVTIQVDDSGPGISPGDEERIFEKFQQGHHQTTGGSVGLGLAICQAILRVHGGSIWVTNRPQGGASFRFNIPIEGESPVLPPEKSGDEGTQS